MVSAECAVGSGKYGADCLACPVCANSGTCFDGPDGNGTCACPPTTTGALCETCAPRYNPNTNCTTECAAGSGLYGTECRACPVCANFGKCNDGADGNGTCACPPTTSGTLCENCMPNYDPNTKCTSVLDACAKPTSDTTAEDSAFAKYCQLKAHGECITDFNIVPTQSKCGCAPGFELDVETDECDDVDECTEKPSPCVDVLFSTCTNLVGTYNCTCKKGYVATTVDPQFIVSTCVKPAPPAKAASSSAHMQNQGHGFNWIG
ncbi:hypothetical protein CLOM_g2063 [Closterium sp. NIES-68]|nr:hypothetical protein CLOM_g2063 [Closterium sp. NIES-68]GJP66226.1 hypothetical protein CLOP_g23125 [Closterium sp. NIES-67]